MIVFFNIIKETDLCIFNILFYVTVAVTKKTLEEEWTHAGRILNVLK